MTLHLATLDWPCI